MTPTPTPSQTVGPFYSIGLCRKAADELVPPTDPGAVPLTGRLLDGDGEPVGDGMVELWDAVGGRWARSGTHPAGTFSFVVAKPAPARCVAPHFEVYVFARGLLEHRLTRIYFPDEVAANAADPVLSSLDEADRARLVAEPDDGGGLRFDIHLQGDLETIFFSA
ncbi:MAG: protocatechuate 3,4-dioxygenase, alpha subunit [Gaiellaceae bacterium]|nr:protocatechuate 3,4-dioxygenase, alpha subunit [Gaiellaceae bacterium]